VCAHVGQQAGGHGGAEDEDDSEALLSRLEVWLADDTLLFSLASRHGGWGGGPATAPWPCWLSDGQNRYFVRSSLPSSYPHSSEEEGVPGPRLPGQGEGEQDDEDGKLHKGERECSLKEPFSLSQLIGFNRELGLGRLVLDANPGAKEEVSLPPPGLLSVTMTLGMFRLLTDSSPSCCSLTGLSVFRKDWPEPPLRLNRNGR